jgi:HEAT repeat protein
MIAAAALGNLLTSSELAVPALQNSLQSSDGQLRAWAANALGQFQSSAKEALPALTNLLNDPDPGVQDAAKHAIESININL